MLLRISSPDLAPPLPDSQAEVVAFEDFKALATGKSMAEVKAAGKYRQEGKNYVVSDGDIIYFKFNVTSSGKK